MTDSTRTFTDERGRTYRMLETAADIDAEVLAAIAECIDWFPEGEPMPTEDFIERMCGREYEMDSYDNPAARKIMREARRMRRERDG